MLVVIVFKFILFWTELQKEQISLGNLFHGGREGRVGCEYISHKKRHLTIHFYGFSGVGAGAGAGAGAGQNLYGTFKAWVWLL